MHKLGVYQALGCKVITTFDIILTVLGTGKRRMEIRINCSVEKLSAWRGLQSSSLHCMLMWPITTSCYSIPKTSLPYNDPNEVLWEKLEKILLGMFRDTGRNLCKDQLDYIAKLIFGMFSFLFFAQEILKSEICQKSLSEKIKSKIWSHTIICIYVKITASFRYHFLLVLKYVPDQLPCQIRTPCKCYQACTCKTQASTAANVNMVSCHAYVQD